MYKEHKPIHEMGSNKPIDIISRNEESGLTESKNLCSIFSGSDIVMFIGDTFPPALACDITKHNMEVAFPLTDEIKPFLLGHDWTVYHLIGVNELGDKAMIVGECRPVNFKIHTSIDELNTEVTIYFDNILKDIKGWLSSENREETNQEIAILYRRLIENARKAYERK